MNPRHHDDEWDTPLPGLVLLKPGDVIDRGSEGQFVVFRVSPTGADIRPQRPSKRTVVTTGEKIFEVTNQGSKTQISRYAPPEIVVGRDLVRLNELLNKSKGIKMNLEIGDTIGLGGEPVIVFNVTDTTAQVIFQRRLETIERQQNEFLLIDKPRKNPEERKTALENYLETHKLTLDELVNNTKKESEQMKSAPKHRMAKAGPKLAEPRGGLAASANGTTATPHEAKATGGGKKKKTGGGAGKPKAKEGRSAYTRNLATEHLDMDVEEIHKKSKAKYPNSDMSTTRRLVDEARKELKKSGKKAEAKEAETVEQTTEAPPVQA